MAVTALGPGRRIGIWTQGCDLACPGCLAHDTWDVGGGRELEVDQLLGDIEERGMECSGVSVSGGEPFSQAAALRELLSSLRDSYPEFDVLVYTGHDESTVLSAHQWVVDLADGMICGPYDPRQAVGEHWRGSANQTLWSGPRQQAERIRLWTVEGAQSHHLQIGSSPQGAWIIGIPRPGDLASLSGRIQRQSAVKVTAAGWRRRSAERRDHG